MEDDLKGNFQESIKSAQKALFASFSISLILYLLAKLDEIETVKLPIVGHEVDAVTGIFVLVIMYFGFGLMFAIQMNNSRQNFFAINTPEIKRVLLLNPTLIGGNRLQRLLVSIMPIAMFYSAMFNGFKGNVPVTIIIVLIFSIPYYFGIGRAVEIKV